MLIGIDTGGTYTDAVRYDDSSEPGSVVATAKARTRADLSIGIAEALDSVLGNPADVSLVSLSTTLATNALVEGVGGRVALVFIGFGEAELDRGGLRTALGDAPVITIDGGHDSLGNELTALPEAALLTEAERIEDAGGVDAYAIAAQFSVRNPAHELAARDVLKGLGRPVACSHELSAKLDGPRRALTCLLNARLIALIAELTSAARRILAERGIDAPLMLVRGDGSLVTAEYAEQRPIETILSGPAASLIGAGHLTAATDVLVSDIGGTTTDIGVLRGGIPRVSAEGATVGRHRTMVEAVAMVTHGLGGDSEVDIDWRAHPAALRLGPRRLVPISLLAVDEPELVIGTLERLDGPSRPDDTRFVSAIISPSDRPTAATVGLSATETGVLDAIGGRWVPVDTVATSSRAAAAITTLAGRGLVKLAGFTPSDAAHVTGVHTAWDTDAAHAAADRLAALSDSGGEPICKDGRALAQWVIDNVIRRSAESVLAAALDDDGLPGDAIDSAIVQRAIDGHDGAAAIHIGAALPLVALGAAASTYYPPVAELLRTTGVIPDLAAVANAVGAAVANVRLVATATISQPSKGQFRVHLPGLDDRGDLQPAIDDATHALTERIRAEAATAGAAEVTVTTDVATRSATIAGTAVFVEATVTVTATGRPTTRPG